MTKEQFEKYGKIEDSIKDIKNMLYWCGKKYHSDFVSIYPFTLCTERNIFIKYILPSDYREITLPSELKERIIDVVEEYVDEIEQELKEI